MFKINPYRPGAGLKPMYIAGRDEDIESVEQIFEALTMNVPVPVSYTHLDVYKRQENNRACNGSPEESQGYIRVDKCKYKCAGVECE